METAWKFLEQGGPLMIPIGICSLVSLTVILEKAYDLRSSKVIPDFLIHWVKKFSRHEMSPNEKIFTSPAGKLVRHVLENKDRSLTENRQLLNTLGQETQLRLQRGLRTLEIVTTIAPLLGLAGTIQGLIYLFGSISDVSNVDNMDLAKGIGIALMTTFAGLIVSIPSVIGWHVFQRRVEIVGAQMESLCDEIYKELYQPDSDTEEDS